MKETSMKWGPLLPPSQRRAVPAPWMSTWELNRPPQRCAAPAPQMSPSGVPPRGTTWELEREQENEVRQPKLEAPLTKRQLKHRQNKDSKLTKKFISLDAEISNLKSQMEAFKDKITKASKSTNAGFKRKKIRSMKREVNKINERLGGSEKALELVEPRVPKGLISGSWSEGFAPGPLKLYPLNRSKCIETKIAELNKKIRRAKNRRNKECLIAKREALHRVRDSLQESL